MYMCCLFFNAQKAIVNEQCYLPDDLAKKNTIEKLHKNTTAESSTPSDTLVVEEIRR
jgi:hypothetical protein